MSEAPATGARARVGVDIGGTFTDVICVRGERISVAKVLSTPDDLSRGVLQGISLALDEHGCAAEEVGSVIHATTAATNALLEKKGAKVGLLTTEGFGDILEIARQRRPDPYGVHADKLAPLVPRERVVEVSERLRHDGETVRELDEESLREGWLELREQGVEALAIVFLHSYANAKHERRAVELLSEAGSREMPVFASHEVLPEPREFERASTTVIAAYLSLVTSAYLRSLADGFEEMGIDRKFWVMKSSGGVATSERAVDHPEELVESGPAAGVIAAAGAAERMGIRNLLSFDMGGTTAKASLILDATPRVSWDYEVGGQAHAGGFLQRGTGHPLRVPVIDLAEVGTGGGSVGWIDQSGALRVGPESAGADPGPACYGQGGERPTITDADLVLGYIGSGSETRLGVLDVDAARAAIRRELAAPLGLSVEEAAAGMFQLATAQMASVVRLVSTAKGFDPRGFSMFAFGGAGPLHAWAVARELGVSRVIVPPFAGINSAAGLLQADFRVDAGRGYRACLSDRDESMAIVRVLDELGTDARRELVEQGHPESAVRLSYSADVRYVGQSYDVRVDFAERAGPTANGLPDAHDLEALATAFHSEHRRAYGHAYPDEDVEVTALRVTASAPGLGFQLAGVEAAQRSKASSPIGREIRFGDRDYEAAVLSWSELPEDGIAGPAVLEARETTIVVPPGSSATADELGFVSIVFDAGEGP